MSTGFLAYAENGALLVDMTVSISQMQGSVDTGGANGALVIPPLPIGKTRFYMVVALTDLNREKGKKPGVTLSPNTLSWAYSYSTNGWGYYSANCRIFFGYF